jgi:RNA recognition motif-containing protein
VKESDLDDIFEKFGKISDVRIRESRDRFYCIKI